MLWYCCMSNRKGIQSVKMPQKNANKIKLSYSASATVLRCCTDIWEISAADMTVFDLHKSFKTAKTFNIIATHAVRFYYKQ